MEKFKVSFEANNQQLKSIGTKHASDTYADIEATFVLGEKWTDMDSVSAVWWNDFTRIATVLDSQGKCIVPHEVLTRKGCVRVNLVGSIVEGDELVTRLTSYSAEAVQVNEKIKLTGSETSEITPSQFEQFVENVKDEADRAEEAKESAREYAEDAEASAQNASESASASAVSASDSARSATASAESAQNASEIAVEVEVMKNEVELAKDKVLGMRATAETLEAGSDATASYSDGLLTLGIPRGDQGIQGIQGETGATPNLTIGTVETLEPTEDATATITGTAEEPALNLGIPKGEQGDVSRAELDRTVTDLKSDFRSLVEYTDETLTANSVYDSIHDGYYAYAADGSNPYMANADYISYELTIKRPCTLYLSASAESYLSVCVFDNNSYDNGVRYRNFGSEHTLPTSENPLSLTTGQVIIISEDKSTVSASTFAFVLTDYRTMFNGDVPLAPEHIQQVEQALPQTQKKYIKYVSGSGADSSTEKVEIYIPTVVGYIRYDFLHCVVNEANANIWRMGYATHVDNTFSNGYAITTAGEWECAIKIKDRSDYSGGYMHGDEVMNNIVFIVDGELVDITTLTTMTEFENLNIIQDSDLYDPNDSETVFATHGSEHTFSNDGDLIIHQTVTYLLSEVINTSYMAMFPIAKAVSEVLVSDKDFAPIILSRPVFLKDTESVTLYKSGGKVMAQFSVPKHDFWMGTGVTFTCNDNGGGVYNKCYFANTFADYSVASGKVVKTEARYKIVAQ